MQSVLIIYGVPCCIDIVGTCDAANPKFFDQFREAFQSKFAVQFKISKERVFL